MTCFRPAALPSRPMAGAGVGWDGLGESLSPSPSLNIPRRLRPAEGRSPAWQDRLPRSQRQAGRTKSQPFTDSESVGSPPPPWTSAGPFPAASSRKSPVCARGECGQAWVTVLFPSTQHPGLFAPVQPLYFEAICKTNFILQMEPKDKPVRGDPKPSTDRPLSIRLS